MKKFLLLSAILAIIFTIASNAAETHEWLLNNDDALKKWKISSMTSNTVDGYFEFLPTGDDPIIQYTSIPSSEQFLAEDFPILAVRMRITGTSDEAGFFFGTSINPGPSGPEYSKFKIINDGVWHSYIVDMSSYEHGLWKGTVNNLRLDPINIKIDLEAVINIDRIGAFKTKADAESFLSKEIPIMKTIEETDEIINSGAETPKWIFNGGDAASVWAVSGAEVVREHGLYKLNIEDTDTTMSCPLDKEKYFSADEFKFFAIRYKVSSTNRAAGLFFANDFVKSISDKTYSQYRLTTGNVWTNQVIDMKNFPHDLWKGTITSIRLDPINPSPVDSEFYLSRMGFFRSKADAEAFLSEANDTLDYSSSTTISKDTYKFIIPGGTLYDGYKDEDYSLASAEIASKNPVVMCNGEIVPISNTNNKGFTTYLARKAGTYTLGNFEKTYVDTASHWGVDYINYVSSRKLFGGTSETEFSPDMTMTRGMFITVLGRMHGLDTSPYNGESGYTDVNSSEYYAPYIQWAKEYFLMSPSSQTTFSPEQPITREEMAVVIANYLFAFKYEVIANAATINFDDLSNCSEEAIAAIKYIQSLGIINGKDTNKFDPAGISTRAEVSAVISRVIKTLLGINYQSPYTPEYFSRERIKFGAWANFDSSKVDDTYMKNLYECGFDLIIGRPDIAGDSTREKVLTYSDKYGIEVYVYDMDAFIDTEKAIASYYEHPSFAGHYHIDEPGSDDFPKLGEEARLYKEATGGKTPYVNLLPMYANAAQLKYGAWKAAIDYYDSDPELYRKHCQMFTESYDADYISTDIYPLGWKGTKKTTYADYIESINQIATVARESGREFWCYIQTYSWSDAYRLPVEQEYRWQCYSMLSFGCKGILCWQYAGSNSNPSLVDGNSNPSVAYYAAKNVFQEIKRFSDIFIQYKNVGAFNHNYSASIPYLRMSGQYKNFSAIKEIVSEEPLLFGCFDKSEGTGHAFTIVNMTDLGEEKTATVKLKIDGKVTSYQGGYPTILSPSNGYYTFVLEWGAGVFVTID